MTAEEWAWVEDMPYTISIPSLDSIVVHAGLLPDTPLDQQTEFVMTRMRNLEILEDGTMIPHDDRDAGGDNWAIFYSGPYHASYGHDAGRGQDGDGNPIIQWHDKATGLDSRCVYGGRLSGIYLPVNNEAPDVTQVDCEEYDNFAQDIDLWASSPGILMVCWNCAHFKIFHFLLFYGLDIFGIVVGVKT